jgi:hypothetical protein
MRQQENIEEATELLLSHEGKCPECDFLRDVTHEQEQRFETCHTTGCKLFGIKFKTME